MKDINAFWMPGTNTVEEICRIKGLCPEQILKGQILTAVRNTPWEIVLKKTVKNFIEEIILGIT